MTTTQETMPSTGHIESFLPMVSRIARRVARRLPPSVNFDDLVSAGYLGLVEAARRYDDRINDNFAAYAEIRVRGAMLDEMRSMDWVPRAIRRRSQKVARAEQQLTAVLGRPPERAELALHLHIDESTLAHIEQELRAVVLVDADELDRCGSSKTPGPASKLLHEERVARLSVAIGTLPAREKQVLALYYIENMKLREIGELLEVTESRVCQLHTRALQRLHDALCGEEQKLAA